jgi:hypothetical protein
MRLAEKVLFCIRAVTTGRRENAAEDLVLRLPSTTNVRRVWRDGYLLNDALVCYTSNVGKELS